MEGNVNVGSINVSGIVSSLILGICLIMGMNTEYFIGLISMIEKPITWVVTGIVIVLTALIAWMCVFQLQVIRIRRKLDNLLEYASINGTTHTDRRA